MKTRIISLTLILIFVICIFVLPVSAADPETAYKYFYLDPYNFENVQIGPNAEYRAYIHGNSVVNADNIYVLARTNSTDQWNGVYNSAGQLLGTVKKFWGNSVVSLYRISATSTTWNNDFSISITNNSTYSSTFRVIKVFSPALETWFDLSAEGITYNTGVYQATTSMPVHTTSLSSIPFTFATGADDSTLREYFLDINIPISKIVGLDECQLRFFAPTSYSNVSSAGAYVSSVSLYFNDANIPFEMRTYDNTENVGGSISSNDGIVSYFHPGHQYMNISFVPPVSSSLNEKYITVRFTFLRQSQQFYLWFTNLKGIMKTGITEAQLLQSIASDISSIDSNLASALEKLDEMGVTLDSLLVNTDDIESSLNYIKDFLEDDLYTVIESYFDGISLTFDQVHDEIQDMNTYLKSINQYSGQILSVLNGQIKVTLDNIRNYLRSMLDIMQGSVQDDELADERQEQASQIQQGNDVIGSVIKPSVSADETDITQVVDQSSMNMLVVGLNTFANVPLFHNMMLFVAMIMLASFVFFGKKG